MFDQDLCGTCDMNSTLGSVVPLAMFLILVLVCNFDMLGSSFVETPPKASCMSNCRLCEGGSDQLVINDRQSSICQLTEPRQLLELSAPNLKKSFTKFARQRCLLSIQGKYS